MSSTRFRRIKRLGAALTAGALGVGFLPVAALTSTASAATPPPGAIDTSAFCANTPPDNPFTDLPASDVHFDNVLCMAFAGITKGTTATTYDPSDNVRRDQMASFIARSIDKANELEDASGPDVPLSDLSAPGTAPDAGFSDVAGDTHEDNINRLAEQNIVLGLSAPQCDDLGVPSPCYGPAEPVTRAQMASFINRAIGFLTGTPLSSTDDFFDDDNGNVHEDDINGIASVGIVQGQVGGDYNPDGFVPRDQMASFIMRMLAYLNSIGDIVILPAPIAPSNQDFPIDPQIPSLNIASSSASDNTGRHHYDVTIPDTTAVPAVDMMVLPASAVNLDTSNFPDITVYFEDDNHDGRADFVDSTIPGLNTFATIEQVNNVATNTNYINNQPTTGGTIGVDIDSQIPVDATFLLVFQDTNNDNRLSLDANDQPTEPFGLSGFKGWTNCESEFQSNFLGQVAIGGNPLALLFDTFSALSGSPATSDPNCAALVANFGGLGTRFEYDDNDVFRVEGVLVDKATFESALSRGDTVSANYNPDPAAVSEFNIVTNLGYDAPALSAAATNLDAGATGNDVAIEINTPPSNEADAEYVIQRRSTAGGDGICGTGDDTPGQTSGYTDVTTLVLDSLAGEDPGDTLTFGDLNVPDGCYEYRATVTNPDTNEFRTSNVVHVNVPAPPDTTKPFLLQAIMDDNGNPNQLDSGDVIDLIWNEQVTPEAGDQIQITDIDGEFTNIILGTGNTFTVVTRGGAATLGQTELHIVLTANPTVAGDIDGNVGNNDGVLDFNVAQALAVDGATGITDVAGNNWEPSGDLLVVDTVGPNIASDNSIVGENTFDIFFSEPVVPASAGDPANYKVDNDGTFGDNVGTNPVIGVTVSNSSTIGTAPFVSGWTKVTVKVQLPINSNTAVSQTVTDKLGNTGTDTQAAPYTLNTGGLIVLTQGGGQPNESGQCDILGVSLARRPTQSVFISLGSSDTSEGTVSPTGPLTFTPSNFSTPQNVNVCGVDDTIDDGDQPFAIIAHSTSSEPEFDNVNQATNYTNLDDDTAGLSITGDPVNITETGPDGQFTVALTADPGGTVNIQVSSNSTGDFTVSPTVLTFDSSNFSVPQPVAVHPIDDAACVNPSNLHADLEVLPGAPAAYDGLTDQVQVISTGPEDVCGQPQITSAVMNPGTSDIDVSFNENVDCRAGVVEAANNFTWNESAINAFPDSRTGTNIVALDGDTCRVTFDGGNWDSEDAGDVTYTGDSNATCGGYPPASGCPTDVVDLNPGPPDTAARVGDQSHPASLTGGPTIVSITADAASDTVHVNFSEPIKCSTLDVSDFDVTITPVGSVGHPTGFDLSSCSSPEDNDVTLNVGTDFAAGATVGVSIPLANSVLDHTNDGNPAGTSASTTAT